MKKLLIVVDYQIDFVSGALGFENADKLEEGIVARIKIAQSSGEDIVFTRDVHEENYMETEEGKNLPVLHCIRGSEGTKFFGRVEELSKGYKVFEKATFGSIELAKYLDGKHYDEITLIGLVSYICVLSNAVIAKAAIPNAHIVVEKDLTSAAFIHEQEVGFEALRNIHVEIR